MLEIISREIDNKTCFNNFLGSECITGNKTFIDLFLYHRGGQDTKLNDALIFPSTSQYL